MYQKQIEFYKKQLLIVVLFLFTAASVFSQNQRCTIYFKDTNTVVGLGKLKSDGNIKFKKDEESKSEIYGKDIIDKIAINKNGTIETFQYKKIKDDVAQWMKIIIEGKISLYTNDTAGFNFAPIGGGTMSGFGGMSNVGMSYGGGATVIYYYVSHEGDKDVFKITSFGNISKNFKNVASDFFKDCPQLVEKIQNKTYTKNDIEEVVKFYNSECNKVESTITSDLD